MPKRLLPMFKNEGYLLADLALRVCTSFACAGPKQSKKITLHLVCKVCRNDLKKSGNLSFILSPFASTAGLKRPMLTMRNVTSTMEGVTVHPSTKRLFRTSLCFSEIKVRFRKLILRLALYVSAQRNKRKTHNQETRAMKNTTESVLISWASSTLNAYVWW